MNTRYIILASAILLASGVAAGAQNLDPTVEVSRTYQAGHAEVNKPFIQMAVPDTVQQFKSHFDYSVNATPYKGSYTFRPYTLDVRPESVPQREKSLFVRLGAGYPLNATGDLVWSPRIKSDSFGMSVYASNRSYFGSYRLLSAPASDLQSAILPTAISGTPIRIGWPEDKPRYNGGYETRTTAGIEGRADWTGSYFTFDVGYLGSAARSRSASVADSASRHSFNALKADIRLATKDLGYSRFFYDVSLSYLYGTDRFLPIYLSSPTGNVYALNENDFALRALLGPHLNPDSSLLFDAGVEFTSCRNYFDASAGRVYVTPKYTTSYGIWDFSLGVQLSAVFGGDRMYSRRGQIIYPDIEISVEPVAGYLDIYFKADGGEKINKYSDLVLGNPLVSMNYDRRYFLDNDLPLLDVTVERINARLGLKGNFGSRFSYDLRGGYAGYSGLQLDAVAVDGNLNLNPAIVYSDCGMGYVALDAFWHSESIRVDAALAYRHTNLLEKGREGFCPAPFTADIDAVYTWKGRISAGLHWKSATRRTGLASVRLAAAEGYSAVPLKMYIPGYIDLGLSAEYKFTGPFSLWVYGGNLLGQTIALTPLCSRAGVNFTVGFTLQM